MDEQENSKQTQITIVYLDSEEMIFEDVQGYSVRDTLILITDVDGDNHIIPLVNTFAVTIRIKE